MLLTSSSGSVRETTGGAVALTSSFSTSSSVLREISGLLFLFAALCAGVLLSVRSNHTIYVVVKQLNISLECIHVRIYGRKLFLEGVHELRSARAVLSGILCCESRSEDIDSGYLRTSSVVIPSATSFSSMLLGLLGTSVFSKNACILFDMAGLLVVALLVPGVERARILSKICEKISRSFCVAVTPATPCVSAMRRRGRKTLSSSSLEAPASVSGKTATSIFVFDRGASGRLEGRA